MDLGLSHPTHCEGVGRDPQSRSRQAVPPGLRLPPPPCRQGSCPAGPGRWYAGHPDQRHWPPCAPGTGSCRTALRARARPHPCRMPPRPQGRYDGLPVHASRRTRGHLLWPPAPSIHDPLSGPPGRGMVAGYEVSMKINKYPIETTLPRCARGVDFPVGDLPS
mgnify:CR=1 FL=1